MSTQAQSGERPSGASSHAEESVTPDQQVQHELQLLIQRHAEFTRRLESILGELQGSASTPSATPVAQGSAATSTQIPVNISKEISRLNDRISRMEEQFDALWRQLGINSVRIQEILDSRTWKIFTGMGGILLKLAGRR